jgi:hypothetical protein
MSTVDVAEIVWIAYSKQQIAHDGYELESGINDIGLVQTDEPAPLDGKIR